MFDVLAVCGKRSDPLKSAQCSAVFGDLVEAWGMPGDGVREMWLDRFGRMQGDVLLEAVVGAVRQWKSWPAWSHFVTHGYQPALDDRSSERWNKKLRGGISGHDETISEGNTQ